MAGDIEKFVRKLADLGASPAEIEQFVALAPGEDEWLLLCLSVIRDDRRGVIAHQKKTRASNRNARRAADPSERIVDAMRARIWAALRGRSDGALFSRLGYSVDELTAHLRAGFAQGMCWANYGMWHVDHVKPCALFDQTDDVQFAECWSLSNLQPLWKSDNIKKGASYAAS